MIKGIGLVCVWVLDYDEAYEFYVNKLGLVVGFDAPMEGGGRWLVLHAADQPEVPIMLTVPEPPLTSEENAAAIRQLMATGLLGPGSLATDDCRRDYKELSAKGVEFIEEPSDRFYGVDAGFRDPFGNHWRLTEPKPVDQVSGPV